MRVGGLFSGIGGIELGLERAGFGIRWMCESDGFCQRVLAHHWPSVPIYDDVRAINGSEPRIDIITGGFPCQDLSTAGKGAGLNGERSGLWWSMLAAIRVHRPRWVLAENVPALKGRGADEVITSLEREGYTVWPVVVGAWAVGAPHKRERVWIVGKLEHAKGDQRQLPGHPSPDSQGRWPAESGGAGDMADTSHGGCGAGAGLRRDGESRGGREPDRPNQAVAAPCDPRLEGHGVRGSGSEPQEPVPSGPCGYGWPARPGEPQHEWEEPRLAYAMRGPGHGCGEQRDDSDDRGDGDAGPETQLQRTPERSVGVATDGLSERSLRRWNREALKAAGNAVVPQIPEMIGAWIIEEHARMQKSEAT